MEDRRLGPKQREARRRRSAAAVMAAGGLLTGALVLTPHSALDAAQLVIGLMVTAGCFVGAYFTHPAHMMPASRERIAAGGSGLGASCALLWAALALGGCHYYLAGGTLLFIANLAVLSLTFGLAVRIDGQTVADRLWRGVTSPRLT